LCESAAAHGATRLTIYDTNGGADPFAVTELIGALRRAVPVSLELFFHAHDDLGLATANTLAAVLAGADGLDATVNGLGDRAGNCALEQIALLLHLKGFQTGIALAALRELCGAVAAESGVAVAPLAPVVGACCFAHKSPAHLDEGATLFEAYDPALLGIARTMIQEEGS
ncbi:MAG: homocitrate synthase, partial [Deltaproteobacteria bacterium]|nr:homocitrate synthase [Deltaproteobacteria bacterium]